MSAEHVDAMSSINVSLPQSLREFVEARSGQGYGSVSEYIRELIRRDRKDAAREAVDSLLLQGMRSGKPIEADPEYWKAKRARLEHRGTARTRK